MLGNITPGSVYAHIDQSLGPWQQRPVFKTNVKSFVILRRITPFVSLEDLHLLTTYFPTKDYSFDLDPSFEPDSDCPKHENTVIFGILQKFNRVNLVVPENAEHMYFAAIEKKSCKLTVLGEHYWNLVKKEMI